jgi:WD40 repeat protein
VYESTPVITSLDFSPDGTLLAVSGHHEVLLHSADGSQLVARLVGVSERIQSVKFSPDGEFLAVAGGSPSRFGEIQVWHVPTRKLRVSATATHDTVYGVSWSDDSILVAFGCSDNTLRAIDSRSGREVLYQGAHTDWVLDTVFSKESRFLASVSRDMSMKLTEVETQRFIDNVTSITPGVLKGGLMAVARNPVKRDTKVTNTEKGTDQSEKWYDELLVGGADGVPRLFQMHRTKKRVIGDDSNKIRDYAGMPGRIFALDFSPDGSRFAAGSSDNGSGEVRIYKTADGEIIGKLTGSSPAYALAYRPDGKQIAVGGFDGNVRLLDPDTARVIKTFVPVPLSR